MALHTVVKGDHLQKLAKENGLTDWRDIYDAPENAEFRKLRPDPNFIFPGDQVFIPDLLPPAPFTIDPGTHQPFEVSSPLLRLQFKVTNAFGAHPLVGKDYELSVLDQVFEGQVPANGIIDHEVLASATTATLTVTPEPGGESIVFQIDIAQLAPIDTTEGIQARLQSLGYQIGEIDGVNDARVRHAVVRFQRQHGLTVDGIAGPQTQAKLKQVYGS